MTEAMKAYYVKYDENDVVLIDVLYGVCYVKYAKIMSNGNKLLCEACQSV